MAEDLYQNKDESNDRSSPNGNQSDVKDDDICRDYLRNVCRRGGSCKYRHPDEGDISSLDKMVDFVFCHDYQNRECRRQNCRFVHASKLEEEGFRVTGKLPPHVLERVNVMKGYGDLVGSIVGGGLVDVIPICKDYLKGECRRGQGRCKFRHLTQREADIELGLVPPPGHGYGGHGHGQHGDLYGRFQSPLHQLPPAHHAYGGHPSTQPMTNGHHHGPYSHQPPPPLPPPPLPHHMSRAGMSSNHYSPLPPGGSSVPPYPSTRGYGRRDPFCDPVYVPPEKKSRSFDPFGDPNDANGANPPGGGNSSSAQSQPGGVTSRLPSLGIPSVSSYALEDENSALRRRVEELKKQVADLMATNEFLLEQNAQLRACTKSSSSSVSGSLSTGTVTALAAVASTGTPGQVVTPVGVTTATVELPVVSIAGLSAVTGLPVSSISAVTGIPVSVSSISAVTGIPVSAVTGIPVSSISASLNSAIISTSSASVSSGVNSALVTYPHIVATSAALNHHNSLAR